MADPKICAHCAHLEDFPTKKPEHVTPQSFRWCTDKKEGRFPMQGACGKFGECKSC